MMKKVLLWGSAVLCVPVALSILLAILLYVPPVQQWMLRKAAYHASRKTGMEVSVGRVRLAFPLDLSMEDVLVVQPGDSLPQAKDTVASARRVVADVQLMPLLHKQVEVDELTFEGLKLNTVNLIAAAKVRGTVGKLALVSHGIDLSGSTVRVNQAILEDARLQVALADSVPKDTTESKTVWKIGLDQLDVRRTDVTVHLPGDTLQVRAYLGKAVASEGSFDLGGGVYRLRRLDWTDGRLDYDNKWKARAKGLDYNHLALSGITVGIDSLQYQASKLDMNVRQIAFRERSGLDLQRLSGNVALDSTRLRLKNTHLKTSESNLMADLDMDLNSFSEQARGKMNANVHATLGKQDLMRFMGDLPKEFRQRWPNAPLLVDGVVSGNRKRMRFDGLNINLPTALKAHVIGYAANLDDPKRLKADVKLKAKTGNLDFVKAFLDKQTREKVNIPQGIGLDGSLKINGKQYTTDFVARQGGGSLQAKARLDAAKMAYAATLSARRMPLQNFLPNQGLHPFSGVADVSGQGTNVLSPRTTLTVKARITQFSYGNYNLDHMTADAHVKNGRARAWIHSDNPLVKGDITLDALTRSKNINATVVTDLQHVDLRHLHLSENAISVAVKSQVSLATDLKEHYELKGTVDDMVINDNGRMYKPRPVSLDVLTRGDTTHAEVAAGDFFLSMHSAQGYRKLMRHAGAFAAELKRQLDDKHIDQLRLRSHLPTADLYLKSGNDNFFVNLMRRYGCDMERALVDVKSSPGTGLECRLQVDKLLVDSIQLDTVRMSLHSNHGGTTYHGRIQNAPGNPQHVFKAIFDGALHEKGTSVRAMLYDQRGRLGVAFGLEADLEKRGIRTRLDSAGVVLGYKDFAVNSDNYLFLGNDRRVSANILLRAKDGTGVQLYSNDDHLDVLQDVTLSLNKIDLKDIVSVIPYMPDMAGTLNGDFHIIQTPTELSVSSAVSVKNMYYEQSPMGSLSSEFVYMPKSDGSHFVDGVLMSENKEVATVTGTCDKHGYLDATLRLERLPLQLMNGFVPKRLIGLHGYGEGDIALRGSLKNPHMDGEIYLDSSYIFSEPYGVSLRFANDPVRIKDSKLLFENFEMFANNDSPLNVYGTFDFSDTGRMMLDIRMRAENFELIDARENPRSEAYGKAFVDFYGTMKGPLESLRLRGKVNVLGTTDMTYVLKDSELATDNQLDELVKFTDFNDSTVEVVRRPKLTGFDMLLGVTIDEAAHIVCMLNADQTNYIDLLGGGDLRMSYNPSESIQITGRYTLHSGEMKYSLPVIPLKTFNIQNGSYIEFNGDPMNPKLNITATEPVKATVSEGTGAGRVVDFDCGVKLSQTLSNPGVEFIISAPNDMTIQDELNTMSVEGRGKAAVTMLVSGMYLTDANPSAFSMNSALSSYLQTEINNIAGSAMRTMGLDVGMSIDNTMMASGGMHTDYNFRFSKRLWNNRLRMIIGGRVSSGEEVMANRDDTFFDNVELEYRLNQNASKYLRLFYKNNTYDWLEGLIGVYGVGFTWRRKLARFTDIFRFKSDKEALPALRPVQKDSINDDIKTTH